MTQGLPESIPRYSHTCASFIQLLESTIHLLYPLIYRSRSRYHDNPWCISNTYVQYQNFLCYNSVHQNYRMMTGCRDNIGVIRVSDIYNNTIRKDLHKGLTYIIIAVNQERAFMSSLSSYHMMAYAHRLRRPYCVSGARRLLPVSCANLSARHYVACPPCSPTRQHLQRECYHRTRRRPGFHHSHRHHPPAHGHETSSA